MSKRIVIHPVLAALVSCTIAVATNVVGNLISSGELQLIQSISMGLVIGLAITAALNWLAGKSQDKK